MAEVHAAVCGAVASDIPLPLPRSLQPPTLHIALGRGSVAPESFDLRATGPGRSRLSLAGEAVCDIDLGRSRILVRCAEGASPADLGHLIADHVLSRIAGERMYCLHAAAVAVAGRAYVLAGRSGVGKSTLALRLARHGAVLLGDDCAAISGGRVYPTFRTGRVWPQSLAALELPDIAPDASGKICVDERCGVSLAGAPADLAGIVLVGSRARRLELGEALDLLLGQRFHLAGRSQVTLLDEALALLDEHGPIREVDRRHWRPSGATALPL